MKKLSLVAACALLLAGCSQSSSGLSGGSLPEASEAANPIDCLRVENTSNKIDPHVPAFSGDPTPNDLWVYPRFKYSNNCDQVIIGLKGRVSFQNVLGDEIFGGGWTEDFTIPVGKSVKSDANSGFQFNEFQDEHGLLSGIDASKAKAVFTLEKIVFDDGTQLER